MNTSNVIFVFIFQRVGLEARSRVCFPGQQRFKSANSPHIETDVYNRSTSIVAPTRSAAGCGRSGRFAQGVCDRECYTNRSGSADRLDWIAVKDCGVCSSGSLNGLVALGKAGRRWSLLLIQFALRRH